ncbi:MAG: TerB family tellurite resistance protein, partial [Candidatus Eisenbacteria bacterium]
MSLLNLLGLAGDSASTQSPAPVSATVREIVRELQALEPGAARYLAAFAYILSRAAHADLEISAAETRAMEEVVVRHGRLPAEQARLVVEIVKGRALLFASTEDFLVTREFKTISTVAQRIELLHCLFAVSAADDSITIVEEEAI